MQSPIVLTGMARSGKTEASKYLQSAFDAESITVSDLLREDAAAQGKVLIERTDYAEHHQHIADRYGEDYLADVLINLAQEHPRLVIDGLRIPQHASKLRRHGCLIISLWSDDVTRFKRAKADSEARHQTASLMDFLAAEAAENEYLSDGSLPSFGVRTYDVMHLADHHVDATRSKQEVQSELESIATAFWDTTEIN